MNTRSQTFVTPENLQEKQKVYKEFVLVQGDAPCVFAYGGIFKERGPHSSHFLLFYIIFMSTIMNGDGNFVCVLFRIFISKKQRKQKH